MGKKSATYHEMTALVFPIEEGQGSITILRATDMDNIMGEKYHVLTSGIWFMGNTLLTRKEIETRYKKWGIKLPDSFCYEAVLGDTQK